MPKSYVNFVDVVKYGRWSLKLEEVMEAITAKGKELKFTDKFQNQREGLNIRGGSNKRQNWKKKGNQHGRYKSKSKCRVRKYFLCHKEGHFKRDCP